VPSVANPLLAAPTGQGRPGFQVIADLTQVRGHTVRQGSRQRQVPQWHY